jgi:hypothetical protein
MCRYLLTLLKSLPGQSQVRLLLFILSLLVLVEVVAVKMGLPLVVAEVVVLLFVAYIMLMICLQL